MQCLLYNAFKNYFLPLYFGVYLCILNVFMEMRQNSIPRKLNIQCEIKFLKCFVPKKYSLLPRYSILNRTCYIS